MDSTAAEAVAQTSEHALWTVLSGARQDRAAKTEPSVSDLDRAAFELVESIHAVGTLHDRLLVQRARSSDAQPAVDRARTEIRRADEALMATIRQGEEPAAVGRLHDGARGARERLRVLIEESLGGRVLLPMSIGWGRLSPPDAVEEIDLYDSVTVRPAEGDGAAFVGWIGDLADL